MNPVIVVVAYNRIEPLKRLLSSLETIYVKEGPVRLIISIDNESNRNQDIFEYATRFLWPFGEKEVIYQKQKLGLKEHILKCGNLTKIHEHIILLEDDLYVSPFLLEYTIKAQEYYKNSENIAGISLYHYKHNETNKAPFQPVLDDSDVYFVQMASSWGQSWSRKQWEGFWNWYSLKPDLSKIKGLPEEILAWKETSWKKYFISYLIDTNKYFVFPTLSYTTNFNDPGTHYLFHSHYSQSQLVVKFREPKFLPVADAINVYDVYFEIVPDKISAFNKKLRDFEFEVDLYGTKHSSRITTPYVLTAKPCRNAIFSFGRNLKPHEINVFYSLPGNEIFFCKTDDVLQEITIKSDMVKNFPYHFRNIFDRREMNLFYKYLLKRKIDTMKTRILAIFNNTGK